MKFKGKILKIRKEVSDYQFLVETVNGVIKTKLENIYFNKLNFKVEEGKYYMFESICANNTFIEEIEGELPPVRDLARRRNEVKLLNVLVLMPSYSNVIDDVAIRELSKYGNILNVEKLSRDILVNRAILKGDEALFGISSLIKNITIEVKEGDLSKLTEVIKTNSFFKKKGTIIKNI